MHDINLCRGYVCHKHFDKCVVIFQESIEHFSYLMFYYSYNVKNKAETKKVICPPSPQTDLWGSGEGG